MRIPLIDNDHSGLWHRAKFVDFARAKSVIGEPTPHMRVVSWLCRDVDELERMWRAGCYLTAYSVITGEALWREWSWAAVRKNPDDLLGWLQRHWAGVHTRKPRRCVRTPAAFAKSMLGFADWLETAVPNLRQQQFADARQEYDVWWASANQIPYFGRYIVIRLLELFRRWGYLNAHLYDIRAVGAHSPIRCLMLLRPEVSDLLSEGARAVVDEVSAEMKSLLAANGADLSYFTYATLLCEYRASYENGADYAGNQHDEELEYSLGRYAQFWEGLGYKSELYTARLAIDPVECLGEVQGWSTRRLDVAGWLRQRGIVWSDMEFDYVKSKLAGCPVEWGGRGKE